MRCWTAPELISSCLKGHHSVYCLASVSCSYTAQFWASHFPQWIWLLSLLSCVSPEVTCQKRRIVGHHACGPNFQGILYVFLFVAHKQMHLQIILFVKNCEEIARHVDIFRLCNLKWTFSTYLNSYSCMFNTFYFWLWWCSLTGLIVRLPGRTVASLHCSVFLLRYVTKTPQTCIEIPDLSGFAKGTENNSMNTYT